MEVIESPTKQPPPPIFAPLLVPASATSIAEPMAKLLMLKEYLELDDDDGGGGGGDDDSFVLAVGVATIRSLLDAELRRESDMRSASGGVAPANGNALGKFAAGIEAVKARCLPLSSRPERATFSALSWKKKKKKKKDEKRKQWLTADQNASAAVGWHSLQFPSPVISSCPSNCSYAASPAPYYLQVTSSTGEERKEHSPPQSSSSQPSANEEATATLSPATEFDGREVEEIAENKSNNDEEEKVRVSLVSMIDYTNKKARVNEEEDEEESFYRSLDRIERTTEQLLHRIRRFEMLAELDPPIPMECCSPSSDGDDDVSSHAEEEEEEEERAWELFGRLKANAPRGGEEKLLLDFFNKGGKTDGGLLPMRKRRGQGATATTTEMLHTDRPWIDGRPSEEEDCGYGEAATLREMERDGRWRCFHEEEDELALRFGDAMLQLLLEELVKELASQL